MARIALQQPFQPGPLQLPKAWQKMDAERPKAEACGTGLAAEEDSRDSKAPAASTAAAQLSQDCNLLLGLSSLLTAPANGKPYDWAAQALDSAKIASMSPYALTPGGTATLLSLANRPSMSAYTPHEQQPLSPFAAFLSSANTPSFGAPLTASGLASSRHPFSWTPTATAVTYSPPGLALPALTSSTPTAASLEVLPILNTAIPGLGPPSLAPFTNEPVKQQSREEPVQSADPPAAPERPVSRLSLKRSIAVSLQPFKLVKTLDEARALSDLNLSIQALETQGPHDPTTEPLDPADTHNLAAPGPAGAKRRGAGGKEMQASLPLPLPAPQGGEGHLPLPTFRQGAGGPVGSRHGPSHQHRPSGGRKHAAPEGSAGVTAQPARRNRRKQ